MQQSALGRFSRDAQTTEERLLRAAAGGQFLDEPPQPAPDAPGYRSDSTGQFVGYAIDEHTASRSTDTGRITGLDAAESVPRTTLKRRYGAPDGAKSLRDDNQSKERQEAQMEPFRDRSETERGVSESFAAGLGESPELSTDPEPVETSGVTNPSGYERDQLAAEGKRPAGGAVRGSTPKGVVESFASGREADFAFTSAEDDRGGSDPFDLTSGGIGESVELLGGNGSDR